MMLASGMAPGTQFASGLEAGGVMTEGGIEAAAHGNSSDTVCNRLDRLILTHSALSM